MPPPPSPSSFPRFFSPRPGGRARVLFIASLRFWTFRKGLRDKTSDESDVHLPQPPQKNSHLLYFMFYLFVSRFWAFRNKGSSKTRKELVQKFKKVHLPSGLITNNVAFFTPFFFTPSVVSLDFFYLVFGSFVTRGVQKLPAAAKKSTHSLALLFFTASLAFCNKRYC
jgi:hypothetical protein